jgi:hypothetical protein
MPLHARGARAFARRALAELGAQFVPPYCAACDAPLPLGPVFCAACGGASGARTRRNASELGVPANG